MDGPGTDGRNRAGPKKKEGPSHSTGPSELQPPFTVRGLKSKPKLLLLSLQHRAGILHGHFIKAYVSSFSLLRSKSSGIESFLGKINPAW